MGTLFYNAGDTISLSCSKTVPTDGLVLRGTYSALTLAVYGIATDLQEQQQQQQAAVARSSQSAATTSGHGRTATAGGGSQDGGSHVAGSGGSSAVNNTQQLRPSDDQLQRVKEEPVRPPESPLPDAAGRSIGESYAAAWTAKHSEVALREAEPPADWLNNEGMFSLVTYVIYIIEKYLLVLLEK